MTLTIEQIEQCRSIVNDAPEGAGNYHCGFKNYYGGINARNLEDLRTIIALHDENQRLRGAIVDLLSNSSFAVNFPSEADLLEVLTSDLRD